MTIVEKINEKTGKFASNIAEAVADLLGKDRTKTNIGEVIGESNNIQEAIDSVSGHQSANIMEAIDHYNGDEAISTTIEGALENTTPSNGGNNLPDFESMTKAELQQYADDNNISGVNQNTQTKAEMIEAILAALA